MVLAEKARYKFIPKKDLPCTICVCCTHYQTHPLGIPRALWGRRWLDDLEWSVHDLEEGYENFQWTAAIRLS